MSTSCDEAEPLESTLSWDYSVKVPPYTLSDRVMPPQLTLDDLNDVGLGDMHWAALDAVLRSTREGRVHLARKLRREAFDVLLWNMYEQDQRTWQECADMFRSRLVELGCFENCSEWVGDTVQRFLCDKEKSDPNDPTKPAHPKHATYHLVERFFTLLDGTVWLEAARDEDTEPSERKAVGDRRYRNSLVRQVVNRIATLQRALIESCRAADGGDLRTPEWVDYEDTVDLVEDRWQDIEDAEIWV